MQTNASLQKGKGDIMKFISEDDAKVLEKVNNAENSELRDAITDYGDEHQWIGYQEGVLVTTVGIIGAYAALSLVTAITSKLDETFINSQSEKEKNFINQL